MILKTSCKQSVLQIALKVVLRLWSFLLLQSYSSACSKLVVVLVDKTRHWSATLTTTQYGVYTKYHPSIQFHTHRNNQSNVGSLLGNKVYGTPNRTLMPIFWYQKMIFWYQKFDFLISENTWISDIRNSLLFFYILYQNISENNLWYQKIISGIRKSNFWYQKIHEFFI